MKAALVGLLAALLLAVPVMATSADAPGFYTVQGVQYYYSTGTYASGHLAIGDDATGQHQQAFVGCTWSKLRPDNNKGRVQTLGSWGGVPLTIDVDGFTRANQTPDSIAPDQVVPAGQTGLGQPWPSSMMATGNGSLRMNSGSVDDPVTGQPNFDATWFVTPHGYRDDATGAILDASGGPFQPQGKAASASEYEMHLRLRSPAGKAHQDPYLWSAQEPSDGTPFIAPTESYSKVYLVPNLRLTGHGVLTAKATGVGLPGSTVLQFAVYTLGGERVASFNLTPGPGLPASQQAEFPLEGLGGYLVAVTGPASLANYTIQLEEQTPQDFLLDLWWDDVQHGYDGYLAHKDCNDQLKGPVIESFIPGRPPPVAFDWRASLFTVGAALTLLLVTCSLVVGAVHMVKARTAIRD